MNDQQKETAKLCEQGAENNTMTFPQIVCQLMQVGFERYSVDFCKAIVTYYLPCGESVTVDVPHEETPISEEFDAVTVRAAIKEAQMNVPGYTYKGFRKKVMAAGCVGYVVSFIGRRAVYFGRTAETHVEHFPQ